MSYALRIAWAANFGDAKLKNVSAPEPFKVAICESTEGSVDSYDTSATIIERALSPN